MVTEQRLNAHGRARSSPEETNAPHSTRKDVLAAVDDLPVSHRSGSGPAAERPVLRARGRAPSRAFDVALSPAAVPIMMARMSPTQSPGSPETLISEAALVFVPSTAHAGAVPVKLATTTFSARLPPGCYAHTRCEDIARRPLRSIRQCPRAPARMISADTSLVGPRRSGIDCPLIPRTTALRRRAA